MNAPPNNSIRSILLWYLGQSLSSYVLGIIPNQPPSIRMLAIFTWLSMLVTYTVHHHDLSIPRQKLGGNRSIVLLMTLWLGSWFFWFFLVRDYNLLIRAASVPLIDVFSTGSGTFALMLLLYCVRYRSQCISTGRMIWILACGAFIGLLLLLIAPIFFLDLFHSFTLWQGTLYGVAGGYVIGRIVTIRI